MTVIEVNIHQTRKGYRGVVRATDGRKERRYRVATFTRSWREAMALASALRATVEAGGGRGR